MGALSVSSAIPLSRRTFLAVATGMLAICSRAALGISWQFGTAWFLAELRSARRLERRFIILDSPVTLEADGWSLVICVFACVPYANGDLLRIRGGNCVIIGCEFRAADDLSQGSGRIAFV
jgi:hypothetical protein